MPHEVRGLVLTIINDADDSNKASDDWQLVLSWCLLAAQQDANGNSYLGVPVDAVTEGDNDYFEKWINQRLDLVFGPRPNTGSVGTTGPWGNTFPQTASSQVSALMAAEVGKGVALGLRAMGHLQRDLSQPGGGYDSEAKGYTKDDIAAVMGFAGTYRGSDLPDIWALFNATKGKNTDAYRRHLFARMKQWAYDRRIQIDQSIYLEQETVKAIVELRFNPGEGVAHLASASKGLTILACRARTTAETEKVREQEHALSATENTRQLEDLLRLTKGSTRAPADNFWELKMNIATFMSLVWVLFGSECDYYKSLRQIYKTLELKEVYALKAKFTPEHCRRITWAILDDGRAFFDDVKTTIDFTGPDMSFPQSYLIDILNNVRYAIPVEWASFPDEWRRKDRPSPREDQNSRSPGGQGGGLRDTPTNRGGYGRGDGGGNNRQNPYGQGGLGGGQRFPPYAGQERPPYQGTAGSRDWRSGWTDFRHPKIKALMDPYLDRNDGRLCLGDVLDAGGIPQQDLPTLPRFCWPNGRSFCAGAAHWAGACSPSVDFSGTGDTLVLMIFQTSSRTPLLASLPKGFRHVCSQGGMTGLRLRS
jgi:hypothetical protein